jgi:predicted dehydrogenase
LIGELQQIRAWGKQDNRAGGEDMMVLGTHLFDLIRLLAGDAVWCSSRVLYKGHEITRDDARRVADDIGPVAGDDVEAQFGFANGVIASFTSRASLRQTLGPWGMELIGSKGVVRILTEVVPNVLMRNRKPGQPAGSTDEWKPLPGDPITNYTPEQRAFGPANRRLLDDWLDAITQDREPQCSGANAMKAIEMVMAVYEAALKHTRVTLPLEKRSHPLVG